MKGRHPSRATPRAGRARFRTACSVLAVTFVLLLASACNGLAFGRNVDGRLGDGTKTDRNAPVAVDIDQLLVDVDAGDNHTCGIDMGGTLYCWGSNAFGQLGVPELGTGGTATPVKVGNGLWRDVSAGGAHTCAVSRSGSLFCWGANHSKQTGRFSGPVAIVEPSLVALGDWISVSAGQSHTCAINRDVSGERLYCWGSNLDGRLGNGSTSGNGSLVDPIGPNDWRSVSAGVHTCGIRNGGELYCWGSNSHGQLGNGTTVNASVPTRVGSSRDWREVDVGERHTCGIRTNNTLRCWGRNANGQVGDGTFTDRKTPTLVAGGGAWEMVRLGGSHTCAIRLEDSRAMCWGAGAFGARGDGTNFDRNVPVPVQTEHHADHLAVGRNHTVVLRAL